MVSHRRLIVRSSMEKIEGKNTVVDNQCPEIEQSNESLPIVDLPPFDSFIC
jgi:hypothetical protein